MLVFLDAIPPQRITSSAMVTDRTMERSLMKLVEVFLLTLVGGCYAESSRAAFHDLLLTVKNN